MNEEQLYDEAFQQMAQAPPEHGENLGPKNGWGGARPGAGAKTKEVKAKPITITLPPDLIAWLDSLGDNRSLTISRLLQASREQLAQE